MVWRLRKEGLVFYLLKLQVCDLIGYLMKYDQIWFLKSGIIFYIKFIKSSNIDRVYQILSDIRCHQNLQDLMHCNLRCFIYCKLHNDVTPQRGTFFFFFAGFILPQNGTYMICIYIYKKHTYIYICLFSLIGRWGAGHKAVLFLVLDELLLEVGKPQLLGGMLHWYSQVSDIVRCLWRSPDVETFWIHTCLFC